MTCDDRDSTWININIKELMNEKKQAFKSCRQKKNNILFVYQFELL